MRWPQPSMRPVLRSTHTTRNSMHKMWIFNIFKSYCHYKWDDSRFNLIDGYYDCEALSHQVKSEFVSQKLFQFQNTVFSHTFQWLLLAATTVEIYMPAIYAMHDGQDLNILCFQSIRLYVKHKRRGGCLKYLHLSAHTNMLTGWLGFIIPYVMFPFNTFKLMQIML